MDIYIFYYYSFTSFLVLRSLFLYFLYIESKDALQSDSLLCVQTWPIKLILILIRTIDHMWVLEVRQQT